MHPTKQTAIPQAYKCATCKIHHELGEVMTQLLGPNTVPEDGMMWVNCECGSTKVLFSRRKRR